MIRQEAQAEFQGDQTNAVRKVVQIPVTEKMSSHGEITLKDRLTQFEVEAHRMELVGFFAGGVAAGAQAIADVVVDQSRLDGVEIDQSDGMPAGFIDHHVVDLGIAVDRALLQLSALKSSFQNIDAVTPCLDEGAGGTNARALGMARFDDGVVTVQIRRRNMKVLKRVLQLVCGEVADQAVEHAQPVAHLASVIAVENHIRGGGSADVGDGTPELSVLLHPVPLLPAAHHLGHFPAAAAEFRWW